MGSFSNYRRKRESHRSALLSFPFLCLFSSASVFVQRSFSMYLANRDVAKPVAGNCLVDGGARIPWANWTSRYGWKCHSVTNEFQVTRNPTIVFVFSLQNIFFFFKTTKNEQSFALKMRSLKVNVTPSVSLATMNDKLKMPFFLCRVIRDHNWWSVTRRLTSPQHPLFL